MSIDIFSRSTYFLSWVLPSKNFLTSCFSLFILFFYCMQNGYCILHFMPNTVLLCCLNSHLWAMKFLLVVQMLCTAYATVVNCFVGRRYMQIRYQFIGDLDMIIVDKTLGAPNLPLSSLYGRWLPCDLAHCLHCPVCMFSSDLVFCTVFCCFPANVLVTGEALALLKILLLTWSNSRKIDWLSRNRRRSCQPFKCRNFKW